MNTTKRSVLFWLPALAMLFALTNSASASIKWVEKPLYLFGANTDGDQKWNKTDEGPTRNTDEGICAAVAIANSFAYLYQRYPGVYHDTGLIPLGTDNALDVGDLNTLRDNLAGLIYGNGSAKEIWDAKRSWLSENAPGTTTMDGQVYLSGTDLSTWIGGSVLENKNPDFEFLWMEIVKCEDVELGIRPLSGNSDWHSVTLTGVAWDDSNGDGIYQPGETPLKMQYLDPNGAFTTGDDGTPFGPMADLTWNSDESRLEFYYWGDEDEEGNPVLWSIYRAYSESPIPEPAAIIVWSLLSLVAVGYCVRRRRKR
ncbi:MAG: hypothetical protein GX594_17250 [Pirellulaceae bacterium]|nr:hypothetical protein [Pirellulaceae bacterium]